MKMEYGKYADKDISEVPTGYLKHLLDTQDLTRPSIEAELEMRKLDLKEYKSLLDTIVLSGYEGMHAKVDKEDKEALGRLHDAAKVLLLLVKNIRAQVGATASLSQYR